MYNNERLFKAKVSSASPPTIYFSKTVYIVGGIRIFTGFEAMVEVVAIRTFFQIMQSVLLI